MVSELVEGGELYDWLMKNGIPSEEVSSKITY
jgi:hypothetical protein